MWLGPLFAERTGFSGSVPEKLWWCQTEELPGNVWQIQAWPKCFTSAEGQEGVCQDRLRAALFPRLPYR
jgi:hypothetical protein